MRGGHDKLRLLMVFLQGIPSAREAAHDRPRRHIENLACLLVRHPILADQPDDVALVQRQLSDVFAQLLEDNSILGDDPAVADQRIADSFDVDRLAAKSLHPQMIDPEVLRDTKHPTVDPGAGLPLIQMSQCSNIGFLRQILAQIPHPP